mmetsp:Transcript_104382/g.292482  ORF Transcript_104382/g.292482 Transcript_104382/m.292482 type:complete len:520 (-) Transcript_104382:114-1673(-)
MPPTTPREHRLASMSRTSLATSGAPSDADSSLSADGEVITRRVAHVMTWTPSADEASRYRRAAETLEPCALKNSAAPYNSRSAHRAYRCLERFVESVAFEVFWAAIIVTNALFVGAQVHYQASVAPVGAKPPVEFSILNAVYTFGFLIEVLLRAAVQRCRFVCGASWSWNWFDLSVVLCSLVEIVFDFTVFQSQQVDANANTMRVIRLLRTIRLVRVFRVMRVIRFVRALRTLIFSIVCTLRSLIWAMVLMLMILYVFAVLFTQAVVDHMAGLGVRSQYFVEYWGSVPRSMLTLFESVSNGVSWDTVAKPLQDVGYLWLVLFLVYICFTFFAVLNVVTGVFCQSAIEGAMHDADLQVQETLKNKQVFIEKARKLFQSLDCDHSGGITIKELEQHLDNDQMIAYFGSIGIEMNDAWTLFKLLDAEESNTVSCDDFVMGCMRLKGAARSMDMAQLMYDQKMLRQKLAKFMSLVEKELQEVKHEVKHSSSKGCSTRHTSRRSMLPAAEEVIEEDEDEVLMAL